MDIAGVQRLQRLYLVNLAIVTMHSDGKVVAVRDSERHGPMLIAIAEGVQDA